MSNFNKLHVSRRTTQVFFILLIVLAPFLDIFRFDSATGSLIVLGSEWELGLKAGFYTGHSFNDASHVAWRFFLKAVLPWIVILAVFPVLGAITGRFFCGWFCPEGALFELFDFFTLKIFGRRSLFSRRTNDPAVISEKKFPYIVAAAVCIMAIPLFSGIVLTGYFVNPRTVLNQVINWEFTFGVKAGIIGVAIYMFLSSMIVRHTLCKYVCSAGLMQMLFGWASPASLRIKADPGRLASCTDCKGCEKVCFMNVKPRLHRRDINCVNCGECIEACNKELGKGRGVFEYSCSGMSDVPPKQAAGRPDKALLSLDKTLRSGCYEKTCH